MLSYYFESKTLRIIFYGIIAIILMSVAPSMLAESSIYEEEISRASICYGLAIAPIVLALDFMQESEKYMLRLVLLVAGLALAIIPSAYLHVNSALYYLNYEGYYDFSFYQATDFIMFPSICVTCMLLYLNCARAWDKNYLCFWYTVGPMIGSIALVNILYPMIENIGTLSLITLAIGAVALAVIIIHRVKEGTALYAQTKSSDDYSGGYSSGYSSSYDSDSSSGGEAIDDYEVSEIFKLNKPLWALGTEDNLYISADGDSVTISGSMTYNSRWTNEYDVKRAINNYCRDCQSKCARKGRNIKVYQNVTIYRRDD